MLKYPAQIDTTQSLPTAIDNQTPVQGLIFNKLRDAVLSIESELGVKPSATYSTVKARIDALENIVGNLQIIELDTDLGGDLEHPLVIGFQGRPVSTVPPQQGDVYVWNGIAWTPLPPPGGGGGSDFIVGGDLSGGNFSQTVIGLRGRSLDNTAPTKFQSLIWNGLVWKPGFVFEDLLIPALTFTFTANTTLAEVNQTITTPSFTATYFTTPSSVILEDDLHSTPEDVTSTPTSFSSGFNFIKTSFGDIVTFTLTSAQDVIIKTATQTITWGQKLYWGVDIAGQTGSSFITGLSNSQITLTREKVFTLSPSSTQKIYFACRSAYGTASLFVNGLSGGFTKTVVAVTNSFGFTENYDLYESDNLGLGSTTVTVL